MQTDGNHGSIRRYLLGMTDESERELIEERMLTTNEYFEELLIAEDELIDQYVKGELVGQEREQFEAYFLNEPERRQKLTFALALNRHIAAQSPDAASAARQRTPHIQSIPTALLSRSPILGYAITAVLLLTVGSIFFLVIKNWQSGNPTTGGETVTAVLRPGIVRDSGQTQRVITSTNTDTVELKLELEANEHNNYRAVIETDEGDEVFIAEQLRAEAEGDDRFVVVNVPAPRLRAGDYKIELSGSTADNQFDPISRYFFRVRTN